jgi:hypothetical protein
VSTANLTSTIDRCKPRPPVPTGKSPSPPGRPFAALPHDLRKDPRLRRRDKAKLLAAALLEYARGKTSCWPSNRRLADDLGCGERTVQLALGALRDAGWVRVEHGADTPTGRLLVLVWREMDCAPPATDCAGGGRNQLRMK